MDIYDNGFTYSPVHHGNYNMMGEPNSTRPTLPAPKWTNEDWMRVYRYLGNFLLVLRQSENYRSTTSEQNEIGSLIKKLEFMFREVDNELG